MSDNAVNVDSIEVGEESVTMGSLTVGGDSSINLGNLSVGESQSGNANVGAIVGLGIKSNEYSHTEGFIDYYTITYTDDTTFTYPVKNGEGKDLNYEHIQNTPSTSWSINHNLGKFPSVTVIDSAGTEVVGDVVYTDLNNLTITFSGGFSGKALLN